MTSLIPSSIPSSAASRQMEWCFLLLAHLNEFATLVWRVTANSRLIEDIILRTLNYLDSLPFDMSSPLLAYNQARGILITQALIALIPGNGQAQDQPMYSAPLPCGESPDLPRLACLLGERLPASLGPECYAA